MKNIIETATSNPHFSTLVTALQKADLVDTLSGTGPFTVFAPTNKAFEKIPKKTLDDVLANKAKLKSILTYHVMAGKSLAKDIGNMSEAKTLEGSKVTISTENEVALTEIDTPEVSATEMSASRGTKVNDAIISKADIECSNGVIHVIDTVLMLNVQTHRDNFSHIRSPKRPSLKKWTQQCPLFCILNTNNPCIN